MNIEGRHRVLLELIKTTVRGFEQGEHDGPDGIVPIYHKLQDAIIADEKSALMDRAIVMITTAPKNYDGFGTITLETFEKTEQHIGHRMVAIQPEHIEWQTCRYGSGLYGTYSQATWASLVERGLA